MSNPMMIVDQYRRYIDGRENGYRVDTNREAQTLGKWLAPFGSNPKLLAIVSKEDQEGIDAYLEADFNVLPLNGDRSRELTNIIANELRQLRENPPNSLIIVSDDATFDILCAALDQTQTAVSVWSPSAKLPPQLQRYTTRYLDDLVQTRIEEERWQLFIDYENIHIGLEKMGYRPTPRQIIDAIKAAVGPVRILGMTAYADWDMLRGQGKQSFQSALYDLGIETSFQRNMRGKNSADMKIVSDIHATLASQAKADVLAVVSCDRDFRPVLSDIKGYDKKAIVIGLKEGIARILIGSADAVIYLDEHLPKQMNRNHKPKPRDPRVIFAVHTAAWMWRRRFTWIYQDRLSEAITEMGRFSESDMKQAVDDGILIDSEERANAFIFNPDNAIARAATHLPKSLQGQIHYARKRSNWECVHTQFLQRGMQRDGTFIDLDVGQNWRSVNEWLSLAEQAGIIVGRMQPHHKSGKLVQTWWLPGTEPSASVPAEEPPIEAAPRPTETANGGSSTKLLDQIA